MKTLTTWQTSQQSQASDQPITHKINAQKQKSWWQQLGQKIASFLFEPDEPIVWKTVDQKGNVLWHAYDPSTGRSIEQDSETGLLSWLEQH